MAGAMMAATAGYCAGFLCAVGFMVAAALWAVRIERVGANETAPSPVGDQRASVSGD
jgi:hypothetical protein